MRVRRWPLSPRLRRAERLVVAGFVLAIALVAWGGAALWRSMVGHRATADETLRDHAMFMATNYAGLFGNETWYLFRNLLVSAHEAGRNPGARTLAQLAAEAAERSEAPGPLDVVPLRFFAGDSTGWRTTAGGAEPDQVLIARLDTRRADTVPPEQSYRGTMVVRPGGDTSLAVIEPSRSGDGWVGFEVSLAAYRRRVLDPAPARAQAFYARVYDSLPVRRSSGPLVPIAVRLLTGDGLPLLAFNPPIAAGWTMDYPALPAFSATIAVTVGPDAIPYLMPGGYPAAPGPRVAGVITLALLLLAGTASLAWRTVAISRAREEFTNAVSHELRTPLANIHLYAETLLLERVSDPAARRAALETITREARRLGDMVENVLTTARVGRGETALNPQPDRLGPLVGEVLDAFQPVLEARRIEVDVDMEGDDRAVIDATAVRRILVNLLDNAIRHGPEGQRLRIVVQHTRGEVLVVVEDEGPGIPAADRDRVWLPFARGPSGGSGLGLAVVRQLARLHGGDATVGERDRGARIEVRLAVPGEVL